MKYIIVTHLKNGNEDIYPANNIATIEKQGNIVHIHCISECYSASYNYKEHSFKEVDAIF